MPRPHLASSDAAPPALESIDDLRTRALQRLYMRRESVEALIRSLEEYESGTLPLAPCIPISAGWKSS